MAGPTRIVQKDEVPNYWNTKLPPANPQDLGPREQIVLTVCRLLEQR